MCCWCLFEVCVYSLYEDAFRLIESSHVSIISETYNGNEGRGALNVLEYLHYTEL